MADIPYGTKKLDQMETELDKVQKEVLGANAPADTNKPEFKAAVGMSREWDARKAGREVAEDTLKKLGGKKPDFFLLFSTIHYEKYGGFQELLNGVWEVLPEGTPLIGGTVTGFMNNYGCYTRGISAIAVSYPNMDVSIGIGHNTKRVPHLAARECVNMVKNKLRVSKYSNKCIITIISGPSVPSLPGIGTRCYLKSNLVSRLLRTGIRFSSIINQRGFGREGEVLDRIGELIGPISLIGTSSSDDNNLRTNFSFFNKSVVKNCVLTLALCADVDFLTQGGHGFKPMSEEYSVRKSLWGYLITEIDGKPALNKFLEMTGWSKDILRDSLFYRRLFFYPLGFRDEQGIYHPVTIGAIWGNNLVCGCRIKTDKVALLTNSGEGMLKVTEEIMNNSPSDPELGLLFSCAIRLEALGAAIFKSHELIANHFKDKPFLLVFGFGESFGSVSTKPVNFNVSLQSLIFNAQSKNRS